MRNTTLACIACSMLLFGCEGASLTQIMVVIDSDISVPSELDAVRVEVTGAENMVATGTLTGDDGVRLPRTVALLYRGGSMGPLRIRVVGSVDGADVVSKLAITSFVEGETLTLPMFLAARCRPVSCEENQTCAAGRCISASIDPARLESWSGRGLRIDGGACPSDTEHCDGADNDCDGEIDEDFDLTSDVENCGACEVSCARENAVTSCTDGACGFVSCEGGFADCDGDRADGCEVDLTSNVAHCGRCETSCAFPNASAMCAGGACAIRACDPGFADCDGDSTNGCETQTNTLTDCGACGAVCTVAGGTPTCASGTCTIGSCDLNRADCNADPADGCETPTNTLTDCGTCGTVCSIPNATETCETGACRVAACDAGFADCDGDMLTCETPLSTLTDCGACGAVCGDAYAAPSCATGTCVLSCQPLHGDCDMNVANGCETSLSRNVLHCGACGNVCRAPTDRCSTAGVCE